MVAREREGKHYACHEAGEIGGRCGLDNLVREVRNIDQTYCAHIAAHCGMRNSGAYDEIRVLGIEL
jgi:hypothetical protein